MPEEIINETMPTVVEKTIEAAVDTVAKKPSLGKMIGRATGAVGVIALLAIGGKIVYDKVKGSKNKEKPENEVVDNVKVAERDFVDKNESEE